jgi:AraC-like DNA-binding protein
MELAKEGDALLEFSMEFKERWINIPNPYEQAFGLCVLLAGKNKAKPNYHIGPQICTKRFFCHFVLDGSVIVSQNNQVHQLKKGDLFVIFPDLPFEYWAEPSESPLRMFWFAFSGHIASQLLKRVGLLAETPCLRNQIDSEMVSQLNKIAWIIAEKASNKDLKLTAAIYRLFDQISSKHLTNEKEDVFTLVQKSREYIDLHYSDGITIQNVAKHVNANRSYLTEKFTEFIGVSPRVYLQDLKMKKGLELIKNSTLPITNIALSLGYPDLYTFSRAFKNYYGYAPSHSRIDVVGHLMEPNHEL